MHTQATLVTTVLVTATLVDPVTSVMCCRMGNGSRAIQFGATATKVIQARFSIATRGFISKPVAATKVTAINVAHMLLALLKSLTVLENSER